MPENIIGALFHVAKPFARVAENQKQSKWVHTVAQPLTGKTLGILGCGRIGKQVAEIAKAFGMRVLAHDIAPDPAVRFGTLPNGMRYALQRSASPPGQASIRLRFDAGSMMETGAQALGCTVFAGGTGQTEQQVQAMADLGTFGATR